MDSSKMCLYRAEVFELFMVLSFLLGGWISPKERTRILWKIYNFFPNGVYYSIIFIPKLSQFVIFTKVYITFFQLLNPESKQILSNSQISRPPKFHLKKTLNPPFYPNIFLLE